MEDVEGDETFKAKDGWQIYPLTNQSKRLPEK